MTMRLIFMKRENRISRLVTRFRDSCDLIFVNQCENESFFHKFAAIIPNSIVGPLSFALDEVRKPEMKETRSTLMNNILRLGDPGNNPLEAFEIPVKTSKCTAFARPKSWKRFAPRESDPADEMDVDSAPAQDGARKTAWAELKMRTEFHVEHDEQGDEDNGNEEDMDVDDAKKSGAKVEKEQLVRGYKYGSSYVPCADDNFAKLSTHMGISICGFFSAVNVSTHSLFIFLMMTPAVPERTLHG
jgi:ATP-dependent DNA helicase 2 subunit 2